MDDLSIRYGRQISIPEFGQENQKKLLNAKILIIGSGALGSMVAMQLAGAGIGTLGISDFDNIEISNLQRQFFFKTSEAGKNKVEILSERIKDLNPQISVIIYRSFINKKLAEEIFPFYDFIIDATDNPDSKIMIGKISKENGKPCCIGGVRNFEGQVSTFLPEDSAFEEYFGNTEGAFLPCSLGGVSGSAASFCASLQACEAIKYITGLGDILSRKILLFNLLSTEFKILSF